MSNLEHIEHLLQIGGASAPVLQQAEPVTPEIEHHRADDDGMPPPKESDE